jgi:hypothetical protein
MQLASPSIETESHFQTLERVRYPESTGEQRNRGFFSTGKAEKSSPVEFGSGRPLGTCHNRT